MFGRVPAYTEISHFRAPYKNAYIAGFGAETAPPTPTVTTETPGGGPAQAQLVTVDEKGYRSINKNVRPLIMNALMFYGTTFIGGPTNTVKIAPFTAEMLAAAKDGNAQAQAIVGGMNARTWAEKQASDGKVVFMWVTTLLTLASGQVPGPGADELGTWGTGTANAKEAAKSPLGVVLAGNPEGGLSMAGLGGPILVAVVAAAAVGGVYYLVKRK